MKSKRFHMMSCIIALFAMMHLHWSSLLLLDLPQFSRSFFVGSLLLVTIKYHFAFSSEKNWDNKTENHFSHYPRSQVDIRLHTRLNISTSLNCGKSNKLPVKFEISKSGQNWSK
jgi:hypothetical protein